MSVIIKGMDMPKNCALCFLRDDFHNYCPYEENKESDCPLVEIPSGHGRLIDGDKLLKKLDETVKEFISDTQGNLHIDYISDEFNDVPTILDAEGEEE